MFGMAMAAKVRAPIRARRGLNCSSCQASETDPNTIIPCTPAPHSIRYSGNVQPKPVCEILLLHLFVYLLRFVESAEYEFLLFHGIPIRIRRRYFHGSRDPCSEILRVVRRARLLSCNIYINRTRGRVGVIIHPRILRLAAPSAQHAPSAGIQRNRSGGVGGIARAFEL